MKLSKALKLKNKLVRQISTKQNLLNRCNSVIKNGKREYDPITLLSEIKSDTTRLINLKTEISKANQPITPKILEMGECKSTIKYLRSLNTRDGIIMDRYTVGENPMEFESKITAKDVDEGVLDYENRIESLQEEIDQHNYKTDNNFSE